MWVNQHMPSGLFHPYESTPIFNFRGVWCTCSFLLYFEKKFLHADSVGPDRTPRSTVSDAALFA